MTSSDPRGIDRASERERWNSEGCALFSGPIGVGITGMYIYVYVYVYIYIYIYKCICAPRCCVCVNFELCAIPGWISCDIRSLALQRPLSTSFVTSTPLAGAVDSSPISNCTTVLRRQRGVFLEDKRNSFEESQAPQQFLSRDGQTIVCVHPTRPTSLLESKVGDLNTLSLL